MDQHQYLSGFGEALLFIITGSIFILVTMMVSRFIRPVRPNAEKLATYESGEESIGSAWTQFNFRFYIIALIFLVFEVEIVFLFPWSTVFADKALIQAHPKWGWIALIEMLLFIGVLALGLAYAWKNGFLDWERPKPTPTIHRSHIPRDLYDAINEKYKTKVSSKKP